MARYQYVLLDEPIHRNFQGLKLTSLICLSSHFGSSLILIRTLPFGFRRLLELCSYDIACLRK